MTDATTDDGDSSTVRKHFYLITDHENEDRIGGVSVMDSRLSRPEKNTEGPITVLDEEQKDFRRVGSQVGLGYHDFVSESAYDNNEHVSDVMKRKLDDIDEKWLHKAGLDPEEILPQDE